MLLLCIWWSLLPPATIPETAAAWCASLQWSQTSAPSEFSPILVMKMGCWEEHRFLEEGGWGPSGLINILEASPWELVINTLNQVINFLPQNGYLLRSSFKNNCLHVAPVVSAPFEVRVLLANLSENLSSANFNNSTNTYPGRQKASKSFQKNNHQWTWNRWAPALSENGWKLVAKVGRKLVHY